MHIFSIRIFNKFKNCHLAKAEDFSPLPWTTRMSGSPSEVMLFISRTLVEKSNQKFISCKEQEYLAWVFNRRDGLSCVVITTEDYPKRFVMDLIHKVFEKYEEIKWDWRLYEEQNTEFVPMKELIQSYQNPTDSMLKCQEGLEETKIKLYKSVDLLLERGEKIETMAQKSQDLSARSKMFAHKARKMNRCCILM